MAGTALTSQCDLVSTMAPEVSFKEIFTYIREEIKIYVLKVQHNSVPFIGSYDAAFRISVIYIGAIFMCPVFCL